MRRRGNLRAMKALVALAFKADPWRNGILIFMTVINAFSTVFFAYWLKLLIDGAIQRSGRLMWLGVAGSVGTMMVFQITNWTQFNLRNTVQEKVAAEMDRRLILLAAGIPGIEHHERPDYITEMELLRQDRHQLGWALGSVIGNIDTAVQVLGTVALLGRINPILLLLPVCALPFLALTKRAIRTHEEAREKTQDKRRSADHLFELTTTAAPSKEIRIFSLANPLLRRHDEAWYEMDRVIRTADLKVAAMSTGGWVFFALGYSAAMAFVVQQAIAGQASPGDVLLAFTLGAQVNMQISRAVGGMMWMMRNLRAVGRYLWLVEYADDSKSKVGPGKPVPDHIDDGIDFEGVAFKYPGTERYVLEKVDLHIPAGSTVAIVGDNGVGKTTLVKLLCRFYEPTEGRVLLDGTDLREFSFADWRERLSGSFQDFARFEFIAEETVGVGDLERISDEEAVDVAITRGGARDVIAKLPSGLKTQLGKSFTNGMELSGGQWQKLALARATMRNPLLLVLDEPTAALDAMTEHALFERFAEESRRTANRNGAITVLVSHRFSTVRNADLIVVVEGGHVGEIGDHESLIAKGGTYAELYEMQASSYR